MVFHILTIFPAFFDGPFSFGVVARGRQQGKLEIHAHDLREFTSDRHRSVDDRPFGGDEGMVLKVEPICLALESLPEARGKRRTIVLSAQGPRFDQAHAERLAAYDELVFVCGRYEGVDERVVEHVADEELSIGDFVLSGGEWACGVVVDSVSRLLPGVVGNDASTEHESFAPDGDQVGILDFPQYTRPADYRGWRVPEVLLGGNHAAVREWRRQAALAKTLRHRPELLETATLDETDREYIKSIRRNVRSEE